MGGLMGGGGGGFGDFGMPGHVSPFDMHAVDLGQGASMQAMTNRYAQLGLSGTGATPHSPGGPAGGIGVANIGANITGPEGPGVQPDPNQEPTAEKMDLGQAPSLSGGIPAQFEALMGMIQNANLANASMSGGGGGGGGKGGGGGGKGGIGAVAPLLMGGK